MVFLFITKGNPTPNITWTKDSNEITNTDKVTMRKWSIFINELTTSDTGLYTCKICNAHGCIEHDTQLDVQGNVTNIIQSFSLNVTLKFSQL